MNWDGSRSASRSRRRCFAVACLDLSLQKLDPDVLRNARLVAIHVGMHTAARIAVDEALGKARPVLLEPILSVTIYVPSEGLARASALVTACAKARELSDAPDTRSTRALWRWTT